MSWPRIYPSISSGADLLVDYPTKTRHSPNAVSILGPASKTVGQHWNGNGWMPRVCWVRWDLTVLSLHCRSLRDIYPMTFSHICEIRVIFLQNRKIHNSETVCQMDSMGGMKSRRWSSVISWWMRLVKQKQKIYRFSLNARLSPSCCSNQSWIVSVEVSFICRWNCWRNFQLQMSNIFIYRFDFDNLE